MLDKAIQKIKSTRITSDKVIWILIMLFAMISVLAVFSTSTYRANTRHVSKVVFFKEQIIYVASGFMALVVCYLVRLRYYRRLSFLVYGVSLFMLLFAIVGGEEVNGATRGIRIFGFTIQVIEVAKIGLVLFLARALEKWGDGINTIKDFSLKLMLPIVAVCALAVPISASTVILLGVVAMLVMFFMNVKIKYLLFMVGLAVLAAGLLLGIYNIAFAGKEPAPGEKPGKVEKLFNRVGTAQSRILSFTSAAKMEEGDEAEMTKEEKEALKDRDRQSNNAKIAISEGGIIGKGPGKSTQRYYLSEAFSDFIYASIVEEYGLLGGIAIIFLYATFLCRCIKLCFQCRTVYSQALVLGLATLISLQAMLHILVNVRLLPITGHTLPLISHGGNAYIMLSGAFGMILSVSRQINRQEAEERAARELAEKEAGEAMQEEEISEPEK